MSNRVYIFDANLGEGDGNQMLLSSLIINERLHTYRLCCLHYFFGF